MSVGGTASGDGALGSTAEARSWSVLGGVALALAFGLMASSATGAAAQSGSTARNPHGDLSIACSDCHSTAGWTPLLEPMLFEHVSTGFDLEAGHREVACVSCHALLEFSNVGSACADCHTDAHLGELGFSCETCHNPATWDARAHFAAIHDGTLFPLTGAHRSTDCAACHVEDPPFEFQLTPLDCFSCHVDDYQNAELDHPGLGFPTTCEDCHTTQAFQPANFFGGAFDHDIFFPLRGSHATLDCSVCHEGGFQGTPSDCFACHRDDYQSTTDPNHSALGFPTSCENCHGTTTWEGATSVEHDTFFPLNGVHAVLDCQACHADGFEGTPTDCFACHAADYNATRDPNHAAQGFATSCEDCHSESSWDVSDVDHDVFFPLVGAHRPLDCDACHAGGFAGTPTDCVACHQADYEATTDPNHQAAGFPTSCEACHSESSWEGAVVDHDNFFPLTGAHRPLDCDACHADGFEGTPTDCFSCHQAEYEGTTDPNHQQAGFPTSCESCHNTSDWDDADFDHDTFWPLTGQHRSLDCEECHAGGFEGTPTDCFACHAADYNQTTDPDHEAAGFPTTCEDCHNTSDWEDADFNHDQMYFPIYSGRHEDEWNSCSDCHVVPSDYGVFECIFCHEHNQQDTDDEHDDVNGYVYESQACLNCHPNGEE